MLVAIRDAHVKDILNFKEIDAGNHMPLYSQNPDLLEYAGFFRTMLILHLFSWQPNQLGPYFFIISTILLMLGVSFLENHPKC